MRRSVVLLALLCLSGCAGLRLPFTAEPGWTRLPTGLDAQDTFTYSILTWDSTRNQVIATGWAHQPWCLTVATNAWAACMAKGPRNDFHNAGYAYDPINDRHWTSGGSAGQTSTDYWRRSDGVRVVHTLSIAGMDPAMLFHPAGKRFIAFGGWGEPPGAFRVHTFALDPPASEWTTTTHASGPDWFYPGDAAKMTFTRAGWDAHREKIWYVHPDGVLWWLDPVALTWTSEPTTGTKPEEFAVFGRHEATDQLVAWVGENYISAGTGAPVIRKTYVLNLTTKVWSELPTATGPPALVSSQNMLLYDPTSQRLLLHTGYNYTRETWALTLGATPPVVERPNPVTQVALQTTPEPPPTQTYPLTLATSGTGTGTTTGGGDYAAGAAVTLTAQPGASSRFDGWAPAPCGPAFAMPGSAVTCTASFTALPIPPVTGACLPTQTQTFTPCAVPEDVNASPFALDSKDLMWTWNSKTERIYIGLGDSANTYGYQSGNTVIWSYDAATNAWAVVSTFCQAAGTVSPNFPSDYGVMVYDPGRDRVWWLGQGDGFPPGQEGQSCNYGVPGWPRGSVRRNGFLWLNPATNTWTKVSEQSTASTGGAVFDPTGDRILNIEGAGTVTAWGMAATPPTKTAVAELSDLAPAPKWSGATGGWLPPEYPNRLKFAFDPQARILYVPTLFRRVDVAGTRVESGIWMVVVDTVAKTATLTARAPIPQSVYLDPYSVMSVWDSVNQRVIYPVMSSSCGQIAAMLVYNPATAAWETTPVPPGTHGATLAYDPVRNVVLLGGRVFCETYTPPPNPPKVYLWRYAP
jgi:Divergent InlB B-repeat domain